MAYSLSVSIFLAFLVQVKASPKYAIPTMRTALVLNRQEMR
jgi:hypothetical protein